jgi:penicillin-binding protein 1C
MAGLALAWATFSAMRPLPDSLTRLTQGQVYADILDRHGYLLALSRQNRFSYKTVPLWKIPEPLIAAFVLAEDKRFYRHRGVDWPARAGACWTNLKAWRVVRGASTITEQCVRILHPRARTFFNRWIETLEAYQLEHRFSKDEILEFYINQVPFSHQCRGISEAAEFYFDRTLDTLSTQEMLSLAVMVRAPSFLSPTEQKPQGNEALNKRVELLAARMKSKGLLAENELSRLGRLDLREAKVPIEASHFVRYIKNDFSEQYRSSPRLITTLDANLQRKLDQILKEALKHLKNKKVGSGAILVLDHQTDEILAWVNGSDFFSPEQGSQIDAVLTLRQPGSALKPFLYSLALDHGYTAASIIPDIPLLQPVGHGLHNFKNYSTQYYGPMRLRCALGNSLNVPAVRTAQALGVTLFRDTLRQLGFQSLGQDAEHYGEGLALGNGEVSLYELVRAYGVLARSGVYREPKVFLAENRPGSEKRIFSSESSSLIGHMLSDPSARLLEFGGSGLFDLPVQTAVKTGTSTDYRDAWAVGFNYKYVVGVWMGNLDYTPMVDITGSRGPALVLRSVLHELTKDQETQPLYFDRSLVPARICALSGKLASADCPQVVMEYFRIQEVPKQVCPWHKKVGQALVTRLPLQYQDWLKTDEGRQWFAEAYVLSEDRSGVPDQKSSKKAVIPVRMIQPVEDLDIALDPRIPDALERFPLVIESSHPVAQIEWFLDGQLLGVTGPDTNRYLWQPQRGRHSAYAKVLLKQTNSTYQTPKVPFWVK